MRQCQTALYSSRGMPWLRVGLDILRLKNTEKLLHPSHGEARDDLGLYLSAVDRTTLISWHYNAACVLLVQNVYFPIPITSGRPVARYYADKMGAEPQKTILPNHVETCTSRGCRPGLYKSCLLAASRFGSDESCFFQHRVVPLLFCPSHSAARALPA